MGIRDIRRAARSSVHAAFGVPALYIPVTGATPVPVTIRVHTKFDALGDAKMAQRLDTDPRIIFLASEVPKPRVNGVVSVEPGEAYKIEAADPVDDQTVTVRVNRLTVEQTTGLPVPA